MTEISKVDISHKESFQVIGGTSQINKWEEMVAKRVVDDRNTPTDTRNFTCQTKLTGFKHFIILLPVFKSGFEYGGKVYEVRIFREISSNSRKNSQLPGNLEKIIKRDVKKIAKFRGKIHRKLVEKLTEN